MIFIPTSDLSSTASGATSTTDLDLGYVTVDTTRTIAFRLGNTSASTVSWSLAAADDQEDVQYAITPSSGTLNPDETSDTISIEVFTPLDAEEVAHVAELRASDGTSCLLTFEVVGSNAERRSQYPSRAGSKAFNASKVIAAIGDVLQVYRFDPAAYDPGNLPQLVDLEFTWNQSLGMSLIRPTNVPTIEARLDPGDEVFGYRLTWEGRIRGQFQRESRSTRTDGITAEELDQHYHVAGSLILPAEAELTPRLWALFNPATDLEPAQYKRTVYLVQRQGEVFSVENIRSLDSGQELSHFEADLVALHDRHMGSPDHWNPFAFTYEYESDKPYACYLVSNKYPLTLIPDASGQSGQS